MGSLLSTPRPHDSWDDSDDCCTYGGPLVIHVPRPEDNLCVSFLASAGAEVKGFPSTGGVYVHSCSAMELDFLGLDRFETASPSSVPAEEDAFCARLHLLGAKWWPSLAAKENAHVWSALRHPRNRKYKLRFVGVASQGGVWALEVDKREGSRKGVGRIENAANMEEKCRAIEKFGGDFYPDPNQCPLLGVREQARDLYFDHED